MQSSNQEVSGVLVTDPSQKVTLALGDGQVEIEGLTAMSSLPYESIRSAELGGDVLLIHGPTAIVVRVDSPDTASEFVRELMERVELRRVPPAGAVPPSVPPAVPPSVPPGGAVPPSVPPGGAVPPSVPPAVPPVGAVPPSVPPVGAVPPGAAPAGVVPSPGASGVPAWMTSDWVLVIASSVGVFLALIVAGAILGAINALVFTGSPAAMLGGGIVGLYLGFSSFGVETAAVSSEVELFVSVWTKYMPIGWFVMFAAIVWYAYKFCDHRASVAIENRRALILKFAVVFGLIAAIGAALLSFGRSDNGEDDSSASSAGGLFSDVDSGTAFLYGFLFVAVIGVFFHGRSRQPVVDIAAGMKNNLFLRDLSSDLLEGAKMYLMALVGLGILGFVGAFVIADALQDRILLITGLPLYLGNLGISAATVAMGGSVEFLDSPDDHISLMNWYWNSGDRAQEYFFIIIILIPALLFWRTTTFLDRRGTQSETDLLGAALRLAAGFAVTSWILSLIGRMDLSALVIKDGVDLAEEFEPGKAFVFAASPRASFGLALVWALGVCLLAALLWGQKRGLNLFKSLAKTGQQSQQYPPPSQQYPPPSVQQSQQYPPPPSGDSQQYPPPPG